MTGPTPSSEILSSDSRRLVPPEASRRVILVLAFWSIALGYLEGSVVVYLRAIFYPEGFGFPFKPIPARLYTIEFLREASTIVLLWGIAWFAGAYGVVTETGRAGVGGLGLRRFAAFAFCFGVWDLVYYGMLKLSLGWPLSLLDWDILFLIPLPWTGPVLAPVLVSVAIIAAGAAVLLDGEAQPLRLRPADWILEMLAGIAIIAAFLWNLPGLSKNGSPESFPWLLFGAGLALGAGWFAWRWARRPRAASPRA